MTNAKKETPQEKLPQDDKVPEKMVIAKRIVKSEAFLQFTGLEDVRELIQLTNTKPRINEDGTLRIKKWDLITPCLIAVDELGNIKDVISLDDFNNNYDVIKTTHVTK